ncbi:MAG: glycosyltransferase family 4 protein [Opitutales bacterium]|nr:glycosyltransferase family 4 protein [Opitutales bacterium]
MLIVSSEYTPMPAAAASRVRPLVEVLLGLGATVSVLTSKSAEANSPLVERSFFPAPCNRSNLIFRLIQEIFLGFDLGIRIFLKRRKTKCCLITSPPFFMACTCSIFARWGGVPYVIDIRDRYPRVLVDLGVLKSSSFLNKVFSALERWICSGATSLITVTQGLKLEISEAFPAKEIHLLVNGYDEEVFTEDLLSVKKATEFTVVYHGRLGRFYSLQDFLEVMRLVEREDPSIRFLMIGDLPEELGRAGCSNLTILPAMQLVDLARQLASCHLGLCLLRELSAMKKAFPAKVYDFFGAGLPMFVGPDGELADAVEKMGCGVSFAKVSPEEVAQSIVGLKQDSARWTLLRDQVLRHRENFGRRKLASSHFSSIVKN